MNNLPIKKYAVMMPKRSTFDPHRIFDTREEALAWVTECLDDGFPEGSFVVYEATISPWVPSE